MAAADHPTIRAGTMTWAEKDWRGVFYAESLTAAEYLPFYARHFPIVEVDSTFYGTPKRETVEHWAEITPAAFRFTAKLPQAITHIARLRDCEDELQAFLQSMSALSEKLACLLIQLPPSFHREQDEGALRKFLRLLPSDLRFAVEFRHPSWHTPVIIRLLEDHQIAWVWTDVSALAESLTGPFQPLPLPADFLYIRLLGDLATRFVEGKAAKVGYDRLQWPRDEAIASWALKVGHHLERLREVHVLCGNHFEGCALHTVQRVAAAFGIPVPEFRVLETGTAVQLELV